MDKLPLHISKLEDINKTVEDIISLDKCKPELLKYAKDYHDLLLKNIKTIVFSLLSRKQLNKILIVKILPSKTPKTISLCSKNQFQSLITLKHHLKVM